VTVSYDCESEKTEALSGVGEKNEAIRGGGRERRIDGMVD
jgi:hypothetical protein